MSTIERDKVEEVYGINFSTIHVRITARINDEKIGEYEYMVAV